MMRNLLIILGCAIGLASAGCGSTPAVTTTVTAAPETTTKEEVYANSREVAIDIQDTVERDAPDTGIKNVACYETPSFSGDTTRYRCDLFYKDGVVETRKVVADQGAGGFTFVDELDSESRYNR